MRVPAILVAAFSMASPGTAYAEGKAIAVYVEGPDAEAVREEVIEAMPAGTALADERAFHQEFVREGQNKPLGKEVDTAAIERIRRAARVMGIAAAVVVRVRRDARGRHALVIAVPAWNAPASVDEVSLDGKSHQDDVDAVAQALGHTLDRNVGEPANPVKHPPSDEASSAPQSPAADPSTSAPAGSSSSSATGPRSPATTEASRESPALTLPEEPPAANSEIAPTASTAAHRVATSDLDASVGGDVDGRHFVYRNGIAPHARTFNLFPAFGAGARVALFPLARAQGGWKDIGVLGEYWQLLSGGQTGGTGANVRPSAYAVGLRTRIHPGHERLLLGVSVAYAFLSFGAAGPQPAELPDVKYRSVRPALDARIAFGNVAVFGAAAFHFLVDESGISTRFYAPSGYGVDGELGGALMIVPGLEARLSAWTSLYSLRFNPPAGATFRAGGALDESYGARLAIAFVP
jgi:hypothetical protein